MLRNVVRSDERSYTIRCKKRNVRVIIAKSPNGVEYIRRVESKRLSAHKIAENYGMSYTPADSPEMFDFLTGKRLDPGGGIDD